MFRINKIGLRSETNSGAGTHNVNVSDRLTGILPLATSYGANGLNFPANFPATVQVIFTLTGKFVMNAVLRFCSQWWLTHRSR